MFILSYQVFLILIKVVAGLGVFMLGMKYLSEGVQSVAGPGLRRMIGQVTDNRFLATGTGTLFTLLVQSSSIATVIMVGLINAGVLQLRQAVGFIMGANIGTTITGWILMFKVGEYGLPVLGVAALVYVFSSRDRVRFIAMAVMGLGMVFFGLQLMKDGVAPLKKMEGINEILNTLQADTYFGILFCVMLGCLLTFLVQSSSAALGILIAAASEGLISFPAAAAFILGENIGTTITVVIASIGATTNARRAALAHVLFNIIGVAWAVLVFPFGILLIAWSIQSVHGVDPMTMTYDGFADKVKYGLVITAAIATVHTSFNLTNTTLFLGFVPQFARLLEWLIPDRSKPEVPRLIYLTAGSVESPSIGIEQSRREMVIMFQRVVKLMQRLRDYGFAGQMNDELLLQIRNDEEILDKIEHEIVVFLNRTLQSTVSSDVVVEGQCQLTLAHELESIGDHLANIAKDFERLQTQGLEFSAEQLDELRGLHDEIFEFLSKVVKGYEQRSGRDSGLGKPQSRAIIARINELRSKQMQRVVETNVSPALTLAFTGILTHYRRIRGHVVNSLKATRRSR
ncbi:MAG: Na/Pi cotransporter family protein [Pirellulaceae bacterium]|nr:Na/Pi cotransporter family protein [Pirellulaceae bacterium]